MKIYKNAREAITESMGNGEIVHLSADNIASYITVERVVEQLTIECDDYVETNGKDGMIEFWGEESGDTWHVHVKNA